ncbi:MAG: hypothetical protein J3K34DRAFT_120166 [Monoraphidium minutum]|nr:MAG: hypothetical protein J3K34DRAFT_120166 [Monoraphidium minutum]
MFSSSPPEFDTFEDNCNGTRPQDCREYCEGNWDWAKRRRSLLGSASTCERYIVSNEDCTPQGFLTASRSNLTANPDALCCGVNCIQLATGPTPVDFGAQPPGQDATLCGLNPQGSVLSDPHFMGMDGTSFFFEGRNDAVFALLSQRTLQVNALFGSIGPKEGAQSSIWMTAFGVRAGGELAVELRISAAPQDIQLYSDARGPGQEEVMRVMLPEKALSVAVNGARRDELLGSGTALQAGADGTVVFFPGKEAINKDDAQDGPVMVIRTPVAEITILKETEGAAHLDLTFKLLKPVDKMSGLLGQTYHWIKARPEGAVADGKLTAPPEDFEVSGGLLGTVFKGTAFDAAAAAALPVARRLLVAPLDALPADVARALALDAAGGVEAEAGADGFPITSRAANVARKL